MSKYSHIPKYLGLGLQHTNFGGQVSPRHSWSLQRGPELQLPALAWSPTVAVGPLLCAALLPPIHLSPAEGPARIWYCDTTSVT